MDWEGEGRYVYIQQGAGSKKSKIEKPCGGMYVEPRIFLGGGSQFHRLFNDLTRS